MRKCASRLAPSVVAPRGDACRIAIGVFGGPRGLWWGSRLGFGAIFHNRLEHKCWDLCSGPPKSASSANCEPVAPVVAPMRVLCALFSSRCAIFSSTTQRRLRCGLMRALLGFVGVGATAQVWSRGGGVAASIDAGEPQRVRTHAKGSRSSMWSLAAPVGRGGE